ncbi:MAG: cytochrome c biogenesis protein CcsA, partial [Bacteroidales bacterium]|nr:cytochrome c biogenesis protein CcsA [Bacteroidales bacterium]
MKVNTKNISVIMMVLVAIVLAAGTIFERYRGTEWAGSHFYGSWWFAMLMAVVAIGAIVAIVQGKMWKRPATLLVHAAVPVILLGGALTTWTGQHGSMTLQPGVACNEFEGHFLPFDVTLESFEVVPYAGTHTPMDFVSHVVVDGKRYDISMNNILRHRGYRFYQEDYGDDGSSTLSVAHDPWGIGVTYCGYALLVLGLIGTLVFKNGPFRSLLRGTAVVAILMLPIAANATPHTLPKATASKMGEMHVLYKGRVCPLQTLAKDFTTKLTGNARYNGLTPEQVLSGYLFYYGEWVDEPAIKIKGAESLGLDSRASMSQLTFLDTLRVSPTSDKNLKTATEKQSLVRMLLSGKLLKLYPIADSSGSLGWYGQNDDLPLSVGSDEYIFVRRSLGYFQQLVMEGDFEALEAAFDKTRQHQEKHFHISAFRVGAERLYNALTTGRWIAMVSITLGLLFFACSIMRKNKQAKWMHIVSLVWVSFLTVFLLLVFILRWIVGGHVPMAGGFDSMNLMAVATGIVSLALSFHYRDHSTFNSHFAVSAGMLAMGFCLLVAMMSGSNPPVTNLMPVLNSPLLSLHVAVIMCSYALFFFVMMGGVAGLVSGDGGFRRLNLLLLYPAVALLAVGIIIGALWANISWGSYWTWDPKEVWALITLIVYAIPLHPGVLRRSKAFGLYCVLAFLCVVVTY